MHIALNQALSIFRQDPMLANNIFSHAYSHSYVRDLHNHNIVPDPVHIVLFPQSLASLTLNNDQLSLEHLTQFSHVTLHKTSQAPHDLTLNDIIQLLTLHQFYTLTPYHIVLSYFTQQYLCTFSQDFTQWFIEKHVHPV